MGPAPSQEKWTLKLGDHEDCMKDMHPSGSFQTLPHGFLHLAL